MRIVHVVHQFHPAVGGMESVVWELATLQSRNGHRVRIVTLDRMFGASSAKKLPARETTENLEIIRLPFAGSTRYPLTRGLLRHVKDADVVHVHGVDSLFDFLALSAPLHRRKLVVSTHGGYFHTRYALGLKRLYFPTVTRLLLSRYAAVATVSAADDELFRAIRSHGVTLIENGVNIEKYAEASARCPTKSVIALGRFSSNKRLDRVISFVAALRGRDPSWALKLVGRPADLGVPDLLNLGDAAGIGDALEVIASPSDTEIRSIIGECSIIASASEYEGFGLAAIEGMSAGLFPVLSEIPPFRSLVERTKVGMTVDFSDAKGAADCFLTKWREISANGDAYRQAAIAASAEYRWDRVGARYEALYNYALGTKVRSILGVAVGVTTFPEAVALLDSHAKHDDPRMVVFANAHTLNHATADPRTRAALQRSIVFNDGIGVDIASRLLFGKWFPENMNGTDFVPAYLQHTANRYRIFLLGAKPGIAERAAVRLKKATPHHQIAGCGHGYLSADDTASVIDQIRRSKADILLVAMGDPKQELWLMEHLAETGCRLGFGVGALFDFMAGAVPRAPDWMRMARIEWLYRMLQEPRRLWKRYLVGMPIFLLKVGRQWFSGSRVSSATE